MLKKPQTPIILGKGVLGFGKNSFGTPNFLLYPKNPGGPFFWPRKFKKKPKTCFKFGVYGVPGKNSLGFGGKFFCQLILKGGVFLPKKYLKNKKKTHLGNLSVLGVGKFLFGYTF